MRRVHVEHDAALQFDLLALATLGAVIALVGGYALFRRLEGGFADVA